MGGSTDRRCVIRMRDRINPVVPAVWVVMSDPSRDAPTPIDGGPQPFDNVSRRLFEHHPQDLWALLQTTSPDLPSATSARHEPTRIPHQGSHEVDTIIRVNHDHLAHIEFEADARSTRIHPRLLDYNLLLQRHFRHESVRITQHVIVMNHRHGRLPGEYRWNNLTLNYHPLHLWDLTPSSILDIDSPNLWPLAVLTNPAPNRARAELLAQVLDLIITHTNPNTPRQRQLIDDASILSTIHLPPATITTIRQQAITNWNLDMVTDIRLLVPWVQEQIAEGHQQGHQQGRQEGEALGRQQGQLELATKLCEHFAGPLDPDQHERLAALTLAQLQQLTTTAHQFRTAGDLDTWLNDQP